MNKYFESVVAPCQPIGSSMWCKLSTYWASHWCLGPSRNLGLVFL